MVLCWSALSPKTNVCSHHLKNSGYLESYSHPFPKRKVSLDYRVNSETNWKIFCKSINSLKKYYLEQRVDSNQKNTFFPNVWLENINTGGIIIFVEFCLVWKCESSWNMKMYGLKRHFLMQWFTVVHILQVQPYTDIIKKGNVEIKWT